MPEENNTSLEELKQRIKELKEQGDWEEVERIQRGVLEAVPTCLRAMVDLVIIAKIRDDWEEVERLQRMKMELEPNRLYKPDHLVLTPYSFSEVSQPLPNHLFFLQ